MHVLRGHSQKYLIGEMSKQPVIIDPERISEESSKISHNKQLGDRVVVPSHLVDCDYATI